jgi:hypothetical protein
MTACQAARLPDFAGQQNPLEMAGSNGQAATGGSERARRASGVGRTWLEMPAGGSILVGSDAGSAHRYRNHHDPSPLKTSHAVPPLTGCAPAALRGGYIRKTRDTSVWSAEDRSNLVTSVPSDDAPAQAPQEFESSSHRSPQLHSTGNSKAARKRGGTDRLATRTGAAPTRSLVRTDGRIISCGG